MTRTMLRFAVVLSAFLSSIYPGIQARATEADSEKSGPLALYLTWQGDPTTTMTIRWHSSDSCASVVKYQQFNETANDTVWKSERSSPHPMIYSDRFVHVAELTGLTPGETYRFYLGEEDSIMYKFRTMSRDLTKEKVRFIVGGDTYGKWALWPPRDWCLDYYDVFRRTNLQAAKMSPMFVVIGGDFTYSDGNECQAGRWHKWLKAWKKYMVTPDSLRIPLVPVIGNHETVNNTYKKDWYKPNKPSVPIHHLNTAHTTRWRRYKNKTFVPEDHAPYFYNLFIKPDSLSYRVLDFRNYMSLILLDSGHTHYVNEQAEWLADTLKARQKVSYKFAAYHVPAYPSARDPDDEISTRIRKCWVPIFEHWKLDVAFEHHDHTYKRTLPIQKNRYHPKGVVYLGDGAWGKLRDPKKDRWYLAKAEKKYHFILVTLQKDKAVFQAIDIDNDDRAFDTYCKLRDN